MKAFITKVELLATVKGYTDEKLAAILASKLEGSALDLYMRLPDEDKESEPRIKEELLKEFERGNRDREEALAELLVRTRKANEPVQTYAFKVEELVKLAYPDFNEAARTTVIKDNFVKGLNRDMQLALKSLSDFVSADLKKLVDDTVRLELAGVGVVSKHKEVNVNVVEEPPSTSSCTSSEEDLVERITSNVMKQLNEVTINAVAKGKAGYRYNREVRDSPSQGTYSNQHRSRRDNRNPLKCRNCQSTQHLVRHCPTRFCASCGNQGHDSWNKTCPKYL